MSISVLNTDAGLSGKELVTASEAHTVTGLHTFDRDPNPPFAVSATSAVVPNLDADKWDGKEYTSGTWTPVLAFGGSTSGVTYSTQTGRYRKLGDIVIAEFEITLTSNGSGSGAVTMSGLPAATAGNIGGMLIDPISGFSALGPGLTIACAVGTTVGTFCFLSATGRTVATETNITDTAQMRGTLIYIAA